MKLLLLITLGCGGVFGLFALGSVCSLALLAGFALVAWGFVAIAICLLCWGVLGVFVGRIDNSLPHLDLWFMNCCGVSVNLW